ncbi:MAG: tetratricopeptide repeat-containing sulfotransferase family protein [Phycisphaerales bacterium]
MSKIQQRIAEIEQLIASGQAERAEALADGLMALHRRDPSVWIARGRARIEQGRISQAETDFAQAMRLAPHDRRAIVMRAMALHDAKRPEEALPLVRQLVAFGGPGADEATHLLASILKWTGRSAELQELVERGGSWLASPRALAFRADSLARRDPSAAISMLLEFMNGSEPVELRRGAGFQAALLLDKAGRFREAFDLCTRLHRTMGGDFSLQTLETHVTAQRDSILRNAARVTAAAPAVQGLAMVVALPRSGTTLLEQMLDCHPQASGIGEYVGVNRIGMALLSGGAWRDGLPAPDTKLARHLQQEYLFGAREMGRPGARVLVDKTLYAWMWLPAIASVLPGTACLHVCRDPRDQAVSHFMANMNADFIAFNQSLEAIRGFIALERSILPELLGALGLPHESLVYEDMVADPRAAASRALDLLGLPMDDAVLAPERSQRLVYTLSNDQVRRPINNSSIGRWKNYAFAFDGSWDELAALHESRRARPAEAAT